MECQIREWRIEDVADLASVVNNKKFLTISEMSYLTHTLKMMENGL